MKPSLLMNRNKTKSLTRSKTKQKNKHNTPFFLFIDSAFQHGEVKTYIVIHYSSPPCHFHGLNIKKKTLIAGVIGALMRGSHY